MHTYLPSWRLAHTSTLGPHSAGPSSNSSTPTHVKRLPFVSLRPCLLTQLTPLRGQYVGFRASNVRVRAHPTGTLTCTTSPRHSFFSLPIYKSRSDFNSFSQDAQHIVSSAPHIFCSLVFNRNIFFIHLFSSLVSS